MILDLDPPCREAATSSVRVKIHDMELLRRWLSGGLNAGMGYLSREDRIMKMEDTSLLMADSSSILVFLFRYRKPGGIKDGFGKFASYSLSRDYHILLKKEISRYVEGRGLYRDKYRVYVDTGPLSERTIAAMAGLGWIGKNSMLINRQIGSFTFIGTAVTDIAIDSPSFPQPDLCGRCTRCIESCPTGAIRDDRTVDSRLCISYHTIESRDVIPTNIAKRMGNMVFGCDICNEVCPWNNREGKGCDFIEFNDSIANIELEDMAFMTDEEFRERFRGTAVTRATAQGLARNATVALHNMGRDDVVRDVSRNFDDLRGLQARTLLNDDKSNL